MLPKVGAGMAVIDREMDIASSHDSILVYILGRHGINTMADKLRDLSIILDWFCFSHVGLCELDD